MVRVETLRDNGDIRILRCREGNRIWYQMWLSLYHWYRINNHITNLHDSMVIKSWWLINLQQYYVFFYEKKGNRVRGVLGKDKTKEILRSLL